MKKFLTVVLIMTSISLYGSAPVGKAAPVAMTKIGKAAPAEIQHNDLADMLYAWYVAQDFNADQRRNFEVYLIQLSQYYALRIPEDNIRINKGIFGNVKDEYTYSEAFASLEFFTKSTSDASSKIKEFADQTLHRGWTNQLQSKCMRFSQARGLIKQFTTILDGVPGNNASMTILMALQTLTNKIHVEGASPAAPGGPSAASAAASR